MVTRRGKGWVRPISIGSALVVALALIVWFLADSSSSKTSSSATTTPITTRHVAQPAGATPSRSAQMICTPETQLKVASLLGTKSAPLQPTWADHLYSCRYVYPTGTMVLSVKELSSRAETDAYYATLRSRLGQQEQLKGVAQGAFTTTHGSFVLRKDYKVLLVDTSELPAQFGSPLQPRSQVAVGVGITVLGCWTGA